MSNNYLNEIIAHPFDFTDEEIILNYISLLKGLAVNLSPETLQLFIAKVITRQGTFPLLSQSALLYNHNDAMVRTSARTVVINVLKSES
jgi:protein CLEC16A